MFFRFPPDARWNVERSVVEFGIGLGEYEGMCHYHQTSPQSSFTQGRLISQATSDGRITLTDSRLIVTRGGRREESPVNGRNEFDSLCQQYFGTA